MKEMNELAALPLRLRTYMTEDEGWGRAAGRETHRRLVDFVETNPGVLIFRISNEGVRRIDISFASETVVELARRYRGKKGFCFVGLSDEDQRENWAAAAQRARQPIMSWDERGKLMVLGPDPSSGNADAFQFALGRQEAKAAEYAAGRKNISITNASSKFKQLWEQGFLLRRESAAESGGVEYVYMPIR
jgi:hypothetical protein